MLDVYLINMACLQIIYEKFLYTFCDIALARKRLRPKHQRNVHARTHGVTALACKAGVCVCVCVCVVIC
jgi:hypothetical protein